MFFVNVLGLNISTYFCTSCFGTTIKLIILSFLSVLSFSQVVEEPYLKVLYTTNERYTIKRSFYSNKISTSNSVMHPSQYLTITVDAEEKRQLEQQIKVRDRCSLKLQM